MMHPLWFVQVLQTWLTAYKLAVYSQTFILSTHGTLFFDKESFINFKEHYIEMIQSFEHNNSNLFLVLIKRWKQQWYRIPSPLGNVERVAFGFLMERERCTLQAFYSTRQLAAFPEAGS